MPSDPVSVRTLSTGDALVWHEETQTAVVVPPSHAAQVQDPASAWEAAQQLSSQGIARQYTAQQMTVLSSQLETMSLLSTPAWP